jgi:hypothetical protein
VKRNDQIFKVISIMFVHETSSDGSAIHGAGLPFPEIERVILASRQAHFGVPLAVEIHKVLAGKDLEAVPSADVGCVNDAFVIGVVDEDGSIAGDLADGDVAAAGGEFASAAREFAGISASTTAANTSTGWGEEDLVTSAANEIALVDAPAGDGDLVVARVDENFLTAAHRAGVGNAVVINREDPDRAVLWRIPIRVALVFVNEFRFARET